MGSSLAVVFEDWNKTSLSSAIYILYIYYIYHIIYLLSYFEIYYHEY